MFNKLTINSKNAFNNAGVLSESLIFYQETNLILDPGSIAQALRFCGYNNLTELIKSGQLKLKYSKHALGGGNYKDDIYLISSFSSKKHNKSKVIKEAVEEVHGRNLQARNMAVHLNKIIESHDYSQKYTDLLKKELEDKENLISAITVATEGKIQKGDIKIEIEEVKKGFYNIESNVDNDTINSAIFLISTGSGELYDAEMNDSGLVTNYKKSNYAENKISRIIKKRLDDEAEIEVFHEKFLPEYIDLKRTMDSGAKDFNEFMEVWREAQKFKEWLSNEEPSLELITAYMRKISEKTWLDKLSTKNMRWLIFSAIGTLLGGEIGGAMGTAASLGVDCFDDLILNRLLNNWRPNQYIESDYRDFLNLRI